MAWSWSHTKEAYDYAKRQVEATDKEVLNVIYAEWLAMWSANAKLLNDPEDDSGDIDYDAFDQEAYDKALDSASYLSDEGLAEYIWEQAEKLATCDNGGFNAWICPSGCHTVPFGPDTRRFKASSQD